MSAISNSWAWPDSLDALVAAPGFHTLLLENEDVRVLETVIRPGERTPVHTHCWPSVLYILAMGHFVRCDDAGKVLTDTRASGGFPEPGSTAWSAAMPPHTFENVGDTDVRVVNVELKRS